MRKNTKYAKYYKKILLLRSSLNLLYSNSTENDENTIGNPAPVQNPETGTIWITFSRNNKALWGAYSDNDGQSFSHPIPLDSANDPSWDWVASGMFVSNCILFLLFLLFFFWVYCEFAKQLVLFFSNENCCVWQVLFCFVLRI